MDMGSVIGAGIRVAREHPKAVAIWAAIYIALLLPFGMLLLPSVGSVLASDGASVSPVAAVGRMVGLFAYYAAISAVLLVLNNAAYRAVLRPEDSRYAYLRLGMDELRLLGLAILFFLIFFAFALLLLIAFGLGGGIGLFGAGIVPSGRGTAWAIVLGVLLYLAVIFVFVRLALAFPLTLMRRQIVIGEAWRRSRGHFWQLFGCFIVLSIVYSIFSTMLGLISGGGAFSFLFDPDRMRDLRSGVDISPSPTALIPSLITSGISGTLWVVLSGCGLAMAARELTGEGDEELAQIWA